MAIYAGKHGRVRIGVATTGANPHDYHARSWEVSVTAETIDITNFESGNDVNDLLYAEYIGGFIEGDLRFEGFYDVDENPFAIGLFLNIGEEYRFDVYVDRKHVANQVFIFPVATLLDARFSSEVRGAIRTDVHAKNKGLFYLPNRL